MIEINLEKNKAIYFASDFHLGAPNFEKSLIRERKIIRWMEQIKNDAQVIFFCGDLFDFWFEYHYVNPKGFSRFFGKIAELSDLGIQFIIFEGNHDMWMLDFFKKEFGAQIYRKPQSFLIEGKKFYVAHGDGLGNGDYFYKILKLIFESKIGRFLFRNFIPVDLGQWLGHTWAKNSWNKHQKENDIYRFTSLDKEILYQYSNTIQSKEYYDYYVFGHRHFKFDELLNDGKGRYINLGDWIYWFTYAKFQNENMSLKEFLD